ncbi:MAG: GAF domain-containing protein [Syntrophothermus sp.]
MDRIQKKRLLIYIIIPVLVILSLLFDNIIVRSVLALFILVYTGFIIFLRDSFSFGRDEVQTVEAPTVDEPRYEPPVYKPDLDESFEIVGGKSVSVKRIETGFSDFKQQRTTIMPPDLKERFEEIVNETIPQGIGHDGQFEFVLEKILTVIRDIFQAHSAIFFWYNKKKEKLAIEGFSTSSDELEKRKFDIEDDILSKIVRTAEPELLNDISSVAEADVIRYYTNVQGIKSFVGVPIFYGKNLIAIISVDSRSEDAFGIETIYTLGRFVRVITMMITLFEEKHSESVSQQRLSSLLGLITPESKLDSEEDIISSIQNFVTNLIPFDAFAFTYYDPIAQKFKIIKVINRTTLKYVGEHLEIDLMGSSTGKAILTGTPIKIDDTSNIDCVRYSKVEDINFDGSFLSIPIMFNEQNYGVISFESLKKVAYSNSDVNFLRNSANLLAYIIYSYSTQKLLKNLLAVDVETRTLNLETFKNRLESDLYKADLMKVPGALALIRIDDFIEQESLFDGNPFPKVLSTITEIIAGEMSPLNLLGRVSEKVFAVYFFNATTKDVFIWAEKLRVKIARKPIAVVSKQTTYTVSIGVASAANKNDVDEILYNANLALQKALERGGNAVKNIN